MDSVDQTRTCPSRTRWIRQVRVRGGETRGARAYLRQQSRASSRRARHGSCRPRNPSARLSNATKHQHVGQPRGFRDDLTAMAEPGRLDESHPIAVLDAATRPSSAGAWGGWRQLAASSSLQANVVAVWETQMRRQADGYQLLHVLEYPRATPACSPDPCYSSRVRWPGPTGARSPLHGMAPYTCTYVQVLCTPADISRRKADEYTILKWTRQKSTPSPRWFHKSAVSLGTTKYESIE